MTPGPTPTDQAERLGRAYEYLARARMAFIPVEAVPRPSRSFGGDRPNVGPASYASPSHNGLVTL